MRCSRRCSCLAKSSLDTGESASIKLDSSESTEGTPDPGEGGTARFTLAPTERASEPGDGVKIGGVGRGFLPFGGGESLSDISSECNVCWSGNAKEALGICECARFPDIRASRGSLAVGLQLGPIDVGVATHLHP